MRTATTDTASWKSFVAMTLPSGFSTTPVFVAKLSGPGVTGKNNLGIWGGANASGKPHRLLRTGDKFGPDKEVKSFELLKALPTVFAAARSANNTGGVAVLITFTDKTQALQLLKIP